VVGSFEDAVGRRNLDYFHIPLVVIRGTVPCPEQDSLLAPRYCDCATYPFAILVDDVVGCENRLGAIERALSRHGREAILALLALKDHGSGRPSSLEPTGGLPALSATGVAQRELSADARCQLRHLGDLLRMARPLCGLSDGEAAVLASFMVLAEPAEGDVLIREGDIGDDLFIVISGEAEVSVRSHAGVARPVARLGPGDHFGEIALVTGGARSADVVALTPMMLMKITKETYCRYLAHMVEVELEIARMAASRLREPIRRVS
jgi:CRP-like cAMP-binding protein